MRNLSMKKFGTPMGAGPGRASDRVGLAGVGWPSGWRRPLATSLALSAASLAFCSASFLAPSTAAAGLLILPVVCCWTCWPAWGSWVGVLGEPLLSLLD